MDFAVLVCDKRTITVILGPCKNKVNMLKILEHKDLEGISEFLITWLATKLEPSHLRLFVT